MNEKVVAMERLKTSKEWEHVQEWLEMYIKEAEEAVLGDLHEENNKLKYTEHDINRIRRAIFKKMQALPDEIISYYTQTKESEEI